MIMCLNKVEMCLNKIEFNAMKNIPGPIRKILAALLFVVMISCEQGDSYNPSEKLKEDVSTIDAYLSGNSINAIKFNNGIRIELTSAGTKGLPPKVEHTVKVKYEARILGANAVVEQNTIERVLSGSLEGWRLSFTFLPVGSKAKIYIPSVYAYGNEQVNAIPPNSILVYDVEMLSVSLPATEKAQLEDDIETLDEYLMENEIAATQDTTGIRYVIQEEGSSVKPLWFNKVKVKYTAKTLTGTSNFFTGTLEPSEQFDSYVVSYLLGLQVAFQKLGEGGKATFYIPSPLGFGSNTIGGGAVPGNSNLIYEVELLDVL